MSELVDLKRIWDARGDVDRSENHRGNGDSEGDAVRPFSRVRLDLRPPPPPPAMLLDGLLYRERLHVLQSEPDVGKTWVALSLAVRTMQAGYAVVYIDEEGGPELVTERLIALGTDADLIDERFYYFAFEHRPWSLLDLAALEDLLASIPDLGLAVLDSLPDFLAAADLNEDNAKDVTTFVNRVCRRFREAGAAQLVLDHLPKPPTDTKTKRSRYSRGSGAKLAKADVTLLLEVAAEFDVRTSGRLHLWRTKDRRGRLTVPRLGKAPLVLDVVVDNGRVTIDTAQPAERPEWDGPTECMAVVLEVLAAAPEVEFSGNQLIGAVRASGHNFRDVTVREAASRLALESRCRSRRGANRADLYRHMEPVLPGVAE